MLQGGEIRTKSRGHPELKQWSWESKETKADRVVRAEHCTGEGNIQKFLESRRGQDVRDKYRIKHKLISPGGTDSKYIV